MAHIDIQVFEDVYFSTLDWRNGALVDWRQAGEFLRLDGEAGRLWRYHFAFSFDRAISHGAYVFLYKNLGTKGILVKDGEILREINRPFYQSEAYDYPAAFWVAPDGRVCLVHCPKAYCRLDIEDVETGELLTDGVAREPSDIFHSRLRVSACGRYLLGQSWVWQPWDVVEIYDLHKALSAPSELDRTTTLPEWSGEAGAADFLPSGLVLLAGASEDDVDYMLGCQKFMTYDLATQTYSKVRDAGCRLGQIFAINDDYFWDLYEVPKVINIHTGEVVARAEGLRGSKQVSAISDYLKAEPRVAFDKATGRLALLEERKLRVLEFVAGDI